MTTTTPTTVHVIGKCPVKGCKTRKRNTCPGLVVRDGRYTWTEYKIAAAAPYDAVQPDKDPHRLAYERVSSYLGVNPHRYDKAWFDAIVAVGWTCADHDRFMLLTPVKGIVNEAKPCSGACRSATGPNCECVCGGEGHGANWG